MRACRAARNLLQEDSKRTAAAQPVTAEADATHPAFSLIDTDAHHNWSGIKDIIPYLPRYWADDITESQFTSFLGSPYPKEVNGGERVDVRPGEGQMAGSDVQLFRQQLLAEWNVDTAILTRQ